MIMWDADQNGFTVRIEETTLPGIMLIHPTLHLDERGYFFESFKTPQFQQWGLPTNFVQDNQTFSTRGVLRGLHYQLNFPQGKLVRASLGEVYDIAVDIRQNSSTFGECFGTKLNDENHVQMYIPQGFAHGYYVLSERAIFQYKCTDIYHPEDEYGIRWDDPDLAIDWPEGEKIISEKDTLLPLLKEMLSAKLPVF